MSGTVPAAGAELFFIVGRGRSGTTLLSRHLDAREDLCVAPESLFILNLEGRYGSRRFAPADIDAFCLDLFRDERIRNWTFEPAQLRTFLHERTVAGSGFTEICRQVYAAQAHFAGKPRARLLGDKNPHYSLFVPRLARLFPEAHFIHLVRDPRGNVASYRQVPFDYAAVGTLAGRWRLYNEAILAASQPLGERYLRLRFEDFVNRPAPSVQGILGFLHAAAPAGQGGGVVVLEHQKHMPWHGRLGADMDPSILDRWRGSLTPGQVAVIEGLCGGLMPEFGYPLEAKTRAPRTLWAAWLDARRTVWQERLLFRLPFGLRSLIITLYRRMSGTA